MPASRVLHASTLARTLFATTVLLLLGTLQPRTSLAAGATTEPTTAPAGEQASAAKATAAVTPAGGTGASPQVSSGTLTGATLATIDPASGSATTSVDFETPSARGLPQQDLSLAYNSASLEDGLGGRGWTLNIPSIERRGVADGPPFVTKAVTSTDGTVANFHFTPEDRYSFNGRDLVLICTWGVPCPSNRQDIFPTWAQVNGWRYFRLQNEGLFARFFLDPTGKTWRVEFKDGQVWEFGTPTVGVGAGFAFPSIDTEPRTGTAFRWNLVRKFDTQGGTSPVNIVAYIWAPLRNAAREPANTLPLYYLTDVYDTPAANASSSPYGYAHHTQLTYELPTFAPNAYTAIWRARPHQRLIGVDVTSFVAQAVGKVAASTQRALVRRYHLGYSESRHHSYLSTVQMEGRCDTPPVEPIPAVTSCATLPPTTFTYSTGSLNTAPFELKASGNPINSGAHPFAAITDVNADGLPDLVQTQGSNLALYLNAQASGTPGFVGTLSSLSGGPASSGSLLSATSSVSVPGDYGTGTPSAVFWFPGATTNCTASTFIGGSIYGDQIGNCELGTIYTPTSNAGQWSWTSSTTDSHWAGEWDVVNGFVEGVRAKQWVGDIDADGLADVLSFIATPDPNTGADEDIATFAIFYRTTREENGAYHPFAPLAMTYNHATVYTLGGADVNGSFAASTQPSKAEDLVDFNGDGLLDFMSADTNVPRVSYCTFDGIGFGNRCDWGSVGTDPYATNVPLTLSAGMPLKQSVQTFMHDVDGDGFPDLLAATPTGIVVNFSQDAASLDPDPTHLVTLAWKLFGVSYDASGSTWQLSFADMNGSGVDDLVVFTQAGRFFYVDFVDGAPTGWANSNALASNSPSAPRPGLLLSVSNGLGGLTSITYGSSTD
ncbi:MAG TPA: SpvB/TcaC N-terminal domain-containing protein, partial [Polyangiaceae bacterium]